MRDAPLELQHGAEWTRWQGPQLGLLLGEGLVHHPPRRRMKPRIGNGGEPPSELGIQVLEIQELAGQEKVLADITERPLDLTLGLGPVRLACPRVEAVMRGEVDERAVVDNAAGT